MRSNTDDLIVLEYSPSQKAFHRTTIIEMFSNNITALALGKSNDYIPIAAFADEDDYEDRWPVYKQLIESAIAKAGSIQLSNLTIDDLLK